MSDAPAPSSETSRLVVIGRNSVLWSRIEDRVRMRQPNVLAIGHRDIDDLLLSGEDRVWIFSYASDEDANRSLFERFSRHGANRHVYVSSATANIADRIRCYRYPRLKAAGERDSARILNALTVRIGLIHDDPAELPGGTSAATRLDDLAEAMLAGDFASNDPAGIVHLYRMVDQPFDSRIEQCAFRLYGTLIHIFQRRPCLLRPIDLLLRTIGWRWYGYLRVSNEQCLTTTSS